MRKDEKLSAILLNEDYYSVLLAGKAVVHELSVLRPEYLLLFKAKTFLDLSERKARGEHVDLRDNRFFKKIKDMMYCTYAIRVIELKGKVCDNL